MSPVKTQVKIVLAGESISTISNYRAQTVKLPSLTQTPHLGKSVKPRIDIATGTSPLQGKAALTAKLQSWHCTFTQEPQSSESQTGPQQQHGRHGAPALKHTSAWQQQNPTLPEHPRQSGLSYKPQFTQHKAQHRTTRFSSTASPYAILVIVLHCSPKK